MICRFFTRTLFYHPAYESSRQPKPGFYQANDLPTERVKLSEANLVDAIMVSGSIPVVLVSPSQEL